MRNVLANGEVVEGRIAYGLVRNFAHFVRENYNSYNRFSVVYFDENVSQLHANVNYSRVINNIISLDVNADYFSWGVDVYNRPDFSVNFNAPINLRNKIKINPAISYIGKRRVMDDDISEVPSQIHINLALHYVYSKQLSAYLQLNNLTNSKEDLWFGYREVGFNGLFGVSFSF